MNDYISRMVVLNEAEHTKMYDERDHKTMVAMLRTCPAADVRPVVHGKWISYDSDSERYDDIGCPNCHKRFTVDAERFCDIGFVESDLKFCPNCGADMTGGADG